MVKNLPNEGQELQEARFIRWPKKRKIGFKSTWSSRGH